MLGSDAPSRPSGQQEDQGVDRSRWPYRMRDLCERTGLPRQVIHFYIQQGLVPEGHKTGRNMAYYGDEHVERVLLVRRLQHERFLPLKAIRALLDDRDEAFSPAQRKQLREVQAHLPPTLRARDERPSMVDATELLGQLGLQRDDLDGMVEIGLLATAIGEDGRTRIAREDAWLLELWADVRRAGLSPELGFTSRDLAIYEAVVSQMFQRETQLPSSRLEGLPPERAAELLDRALPLVHAFIARYHIERAKGFFSTL
ncbi:MAG: MerR family transcriptional regulator [Deltaproteobacteria bacterium]|nr:MerR family transcriptional regulator [Deltaproteobacteria bacterium]